MKKIPRVLLILAAATSLNFASGAIVIKTADGLPIEVEMSSAYRDEITVKNTASQRVLKLSLKTLDKASQEKIRQIADEGRMQVKTATFNAKLEENSSPTMALPLAQRGFLKLNKDGEPDLESVTRELAIGARAIRLTGVTNQGVDIPVVAQIYWYTQPRGSSKYGLNGTEEVQLNITGTPQEYVSKPTTFERTDYRGHAVIIYNKMNDAVLWENGSGGAFLADAKERFAARRPQTTPAK